ncbi:MULTISPECIES: epoxyqueuosine reductase QueH [unclassified Desulfurobacterium]|uniref:epoxyqueuosine reductase QueH n=1 Tax=Desulfurobacterium sp. TC5-1 TaxID=1158318 RepID=UPI0003B4AA98|nr:epoxyqueuosine reductase QueH [Desulfurobacterium sp. TC5-1]
MKRVLLHICCAPCACYPLEVLKQEDFEVYGLFYNPNIHPYTEFLKRLETVKKFEEITKIKIIYINKYPLEEWLRAVVYREERPIRCQICYSMRFEMTASVAKKGKFDFFTSTLFYSKYQNHEIMKMCAESAASKFGVKFLYRDFRKGWREGIEKSKEYNLYRQQYCGCIYSEKERYYKNNAKY